MKILLIYPEFPKTFWSFHYALKFIRKRSAFPPLGLLTVASMLPRSWELRLVDMNVRPLSSKDLAWGDYAFVSAMTAQRASSKSVIARCREADVKVVAGGPLFVSEMDAFPLVDHFILNEAEITLPPFLEDLSAGNAKRIYQTDSFPDIQEAPIPKWELLDMKRYASMNIQFSRGCPFNCDFCNVTALFGRKPRIKNAAQIIAELDKLYHLGWRQSVFFVDDNFIGDKRYLKNELLPALIAWQEGKRKIPFYTEASINLADDPTLMNLMVEAGFDAVFVGIETPSEVGLAECSKTQNKNRDLVGSVKRMQRAGLQVQAGFIVGFDSDTASIFQRQMDFIQQSGIVTAMVGILQAPPGTRLFERLKNEGRIASESSGDNVDGTTNIVTRMPPELLLEGYRNLLAHLYAPRQYYQRIGTLLKEYKNPATRRVKGQSQLRALFLSTFRFGFLEKGRRHYWKLMAWTAFKRPALLRLAVTLSIYGHHFRKTSRLHVAQGPFKT